MSPRSSGEFPANGTAAVIASRASGAAIQFLTRRLEPRYFAASFLLRAFV
jgi:hypothetical protein